MWAQDLLLCQKLHWSYDDLQDAPEWLVQRALLLFDAMATVEAEQVKEVSHGA